jgi:hypothetical protein
VLGTGPFQIGAYGALTLSRPEHPERVERVEVSEIAAAVLTWGQITPRTSYFVELDVAKRSSETWTGRESNDAFAPVRLYVEYTASNLLRFRAGRFLTPIGQWNERYAEPLTWTPTRPLTTYRPFAKSLNGLLAAGETSFGGHDVGYALFWAPSWGEGGRFEDAEESAFASALGARVAAELHPGFTVGASVARLRRSQPLDDGDAETLALAPRGPMAAIAAETAEDVEREEEKGYRTLLGADVRWITPRWELSAEGAWLSSYERVSAERGAFVLGAVRISGPVWGVARGEIYEPVDGSTARTAYAGLTVRAGPHIVVKAGRQFARRPSNKIPDGWFLSLSSLF